MVMQAGPVDQVAGIHPRWRFEDPPRPQPDPPHLRSVMVGHKEERRHDEEIQDALHDNSPLTRQDVPAPERITFAAENQRINHYPSRTILDTNTSI